MKTKTVSLLLLLLISLGQTASAVTWYTGDGWGGSATIEEPASPGTTWYTGDGWGGSCQVLGDYTSNWSSWWTMTRVSLDAPTALAISSNITSTQFHLTWNKATNATHTFILGKKDSAPSSISDTSAFLVYNDTGSSYTLTGLDPGTTYYFAAWSYNSSMGYSSSYWPTFDNTLPGDPSNLQLLSNTTNSLYISWTEGINESWAVARYSTTSYPTSPTSGSLGFSNGESPEYINGLSQNTTYYISLWSYNDDYSSSYTTILAATPAVNTSSTIDPPYNGQSDYNTTTSDLTLTWTTGNNSDEEVIIRSTTGYPTNPTDGTEVYRDSTNTYTESSLQSTYYYTVYSYNTTQSAYSTTGLQIPWGGLRLQVYNESTPSQSLTFDLEITTNDGSNTYTSTSNPGYVILDIDEIPYGDDTIIRISSSGYKTRTYVKDLNIGAFYNYTFYLPPAISYNNGTDNPPPGWTPTLRSGSNSANCNNPDIDLTIPLSHIPDSIISVQRYQGVYSRLLKTDSSPITDTGSNATITLTKTLDENIGVYVYNSSLYGGWILIPDSNYTLNSTHCEVSSDRFDSNSTIIKIDYYYQEISYYTWETLSENAYALSGTNLTIDHDSLDSNTSLCKADYYYYDMGGYSEPLLCLITVNDPAQQGMPGVKVTIKRYINTTDGYEEIASDLTDGYGQMSTYLLPNTLYLFDITHEDYTQYGSKYWTPTSDLRQKTFIIVPSPTDTEYYIFQDLITYNATMNANNTLTVTYHDGTLQTTDLHLLIYDYYNGTTTKTGEYNSSNNTYTKTLSVNSSRTHYVYLYFNHTYNILITQPIRLIVSPLNLSDIAGDYILNASDFEAMLTNTLGDNDFGWGNTFAAVAFFIVLLCFTAKDTGVGIIAGGLSMAATKLLFVASNPLILLSIPIIIGMGVLYIFIKKPAEAL